jgi:O-methyltransferase domain/Dimerisation domain
MSEEISTQKILEIGMGFWSSKTLVSAVELGLFTELAKGPADLATLREKLGLHERSARDFLDALVAMKLFERYVASQGLSDRVRFISGDFFTDKLPSADVIVMGRILHDWDLAQKRMLLAKAYDALPKGGALIVYESMIDDDRRENVHGLLMSLNMLIETPGVDYTGADCKEWMREAGFSTVRVEPLVGPTSMAVGVK